MTCTLHKRHAGDHYDSNRDASFNERAAAFSEVCGQSFCDMSGNECHCTLEPGHDGACWDESARDAVFDRIGASVAQSGDTIPATGPEPERAGVLAGLRVYVASSWRNQEQPSVVSAIRAHGAEVYDFRNPAPGVSGFDWAEIDPEWKAWSPEAFRKGIQHPIALKAFAYDMNALAACDVCVLVLPCGRSAHLEAGWASGARKRVIVLLRDGEPELMYRVPGCQLVVNGSELIDWLEDAARLKRESEELDKAGKPNPARIAEAVSAVGRAAAKAVGALTDKERAILSKRFGGERSAAELVDVIKRGELRQGPPDGSELAPGQCRRLERESYRLLNPTEGDPSRWDVAVIGSGAVLSLPGSLLVGGKLVVETVGRVIALADGRFLAKLVPVYVEGHGVVLEVCGTSDTREAKRMGEAAAEVVASWLPEARALTIAEAERWADGFENGGWVLRHKTNPGRLMGMRLGADRVCDADWYFLDDGAAPIVAEHRELAEDLARALHLPAASWEVIESPEAVLNLKSFESRAWLSRKECGAVLLWPRMVGWRAGTLDGSLLASAPWDEAAINALIEARRTVWNAEPRW